jgi:hypothetical protein
MANMLSKGSFKNLLTAAAVAVAVVAPSGTASADVFSVNACPYTGSANCDFQADAIHGAYDEILTITSFDGVNGTFETVAVWDAGNWVLNNVNLVQTGLNEDYGVYALFEAEGSFVVGATSTEFTVAQGDGSIELWLDQFNPVTTKTLPATGTGGIGSIGIAGDTDPDLLLATSLLESGDGSFSPGQAAGDFGLTFEPFTLTAIGSQFFYEPDPFYITAILQGNFNNFDPNVIDQEIDGSANAEFEGLVPEPLALTLFGMGLLGSGIAARRRRKS